MNDRAGALDLDLLGVPVRLASPSAELAARMALCYARCLSARESARPLEAGLSLADGRWRVSVEGRDERLEDDPIAALRALNHELLQAVMLRARQRYYVHAAVVAWRGRGIVLPGLSQAGKSTLALALVLEGARFLSDEILAVAPASGRAVPFPRAIKIRDECTGYFPELAGQFDGSGEGRFVPFAALPDEVLAGETPVAAIAVPRWSGAEPPGLAHLSRGAALLALAESSLNFGAHRQASLDWLADLVRDAAAVSLVWREPRAAARALLRELEA